MTHVAHHLGAHQHVEATGTEVWTSEELALGFQQVQRF